MPVIDILSPQPRPPEGALDRVSGVAQSTLGVSEQRIYVFWRHVPADCFVRDGWSSGSRAPTVLILCQEAHSAASVRALLHGVRQTVAEAVDCAPGRIFVALHRAASVEVLETIED